MNLAWCMLALSLVGAGDHEPAKPHAAGVVPPSIEIEAAQMWERWPMDLAVATRIAFDNSGDFRVIQMGVSSLNAAFFPLNTDGPITIARVNAETPLGKFKTDAMALVRAVEQHYWNLAQAQVALESAEQAVSMARDAVNKAQAELTLSRGDPGVADLAEAAPRLEQFQRDVVTRNADVDSADRSLRSVLGLPAADNRRIVATTRATEALVGFDWDACVDELLREQPDNMQQQAIVRLAELYLLMARNHFIPLLDRDVVRQISGLGQLADSSEAVILGKVLKAFGPLTSAAEYLEKIDISGNADIDFLTWQVVLTFRSPPVSTRSPLWNTRQAQYVLLRARAVQRQVFLQTTNSLSRFFLEVDANYTLYAAATRLQAAAAHRLDVQRAYFKDGRITLDRLLDAVNQHAQAIATLAQRKTTYNNCLTAMSEAKGTLLADRNIVIAEGPQDVRPQQISAMVGASMSPPWAAPELAPQMAPILAKLLSSSPLEPPKWGDIIEPGGVSPGI